LQYTNEELQQMLSNKQMSSDALQVLLKAREAGEIKFSLIDIREVFEYTSSSIDGTDMLLPTSVIQNHLDKLEAKKEEPVILYCRTGNRTGQVMMALERMGFDKIVHLSRGIISYDGPTSHNAALPNEL
jgi:rhodanese-related sulfurtransferase